MLAYWWFQFRHISNLSAYFTHFDGEIFRQTRLQPITGKAALAVHFVDDECACSRFAEPHIQKLEAQFSTSVEFLRASSNDPRLRILSSSSIPAGPSVAIWDSQGELAYFGPYSSGALCGQGDDFVTATMLELKNNSNPGWINQDALGCFCTWPQAES